MPYIKQDNRASLDAIANLVNDMSSTVSVGDLNYLITKILLSMDPKSYSDYNALIGVLECCKLEFYRRACAEYEDKKIVENGDVY